MAGIILTDAERDFLRALDELGVRYMVIGVGAAVLQGADTVTVDIDLWFANRADPHIHEAAKRAGGVWIPGHFGMMPPMLGGDDLGDRLDIVLTAQGLDAFETEYARAYTIDVDGVFIRVLPLERIIVSKRAAGRRKDLAVLPALEAALAVQKDEQDRTKE
jgi:predicted nucleotidyltransferase